MRIGRMRGFAEGDRAVNDCLAAISVAGRQPFCRFATFPLERGITLIRHAAFVVMQNGNILLSGNRRIKEPSALRRRDTFPTRGKAFA